MTWRSAHLPRSAVRNSCRLADLWTCRRSVWLSMDAGGRIADRGRGAGRHGVFRKQELGSTLCIRDWLWRWNPQRRDQRARGRRQRRRARAKLSLLGVFFGIGALAMPFTIATLSHRFSMSTIVAAIGALVLAPVVFCLAIQFPPPKQQSERLTIAGGLALLSDPFLLFACLALAIQSGLEGMSNDWMTRYFKNAHWPIRRTRRFQHRWRSWR